MEPQPGYGSDRYCEQAGEKIKAACGCPDAEVFFLAGGTQTNAVVIDSMIQSFEGVVAADSGHVSIHEAGAVEFTGHKVLTIPGKDGKIQPENLRTFWKISGRMEIMNIWCSREWCIFLIRRNSERCTASGNWKTFQRYVKSIRFRCIWTGHGLDTG